MPFTPYGQQGPRGLPPGSRREFKRPFCPTRQADTPYSKGGYSLLERQVLLTREAGSTYPGARQAGPAFYSYLSNEVLESPTRRFYLLTIHKSRKAPPPKPQRLFLSSASFADLSDSEAKDATASLRRGSGPFGRGSGARRRWSVGTRVPPLLSLLPPPSIPFPRRASPCCSVTRPGWGSDLE